MLHDGSPRTRVRSRLLTAGTAGAAASMLQRFVRGKIHDDCRTKSRGARTKPSSLASSAITDRTSVSHLSVPSCLLDAAGAGGASSTPSRGSLCPPPPPPREDDPTSSGPPKRRRSLLVGRHSGPGGIRYHFVADSPDDLTEARAEASLRRRPVIIVRAQDPSSGEDPDDDDDDSEQAAFSHPLVVEAIECLFVAVVACDPVCVGDPPKGENSSSRPKNTAVRIVWGQSSGVEATEGDVQIPFDGLSVGTIATAMVDSLQELGGSDGDSLLVVPLYLRLLAEEECNGRPSHRRTALFGSQCSRSSEIELARLDGVIATRAGRIDSRQVVSVVYDARRLSYGELVRFALKRVSACDAVFYRTADERIGARIELQRALATRRTAPPRRPAPVAKLVPFPETAAIRRDEMSSKAALRSTCLMCVPLTDLQSTRANALVDAGRFHEAVRLLSPRQGRMLMTSVQRRDKFRETIDVPIRIAWKRVAESGVMD